MTTVKVSPKFQVVIPKELRKSLELKPGERLQMYLWEGSIHLFRPGSLPIQRLRGIAKGLKLNENCSNHTED